MLFPSHDPWVVMGVVIGSNAFNYFYAHLYLDDRVLQWKTAMVSIAFVMFLGSFYIWLNESLKLKKLNSIVAGWATVYIFFNFIGVLIGYNLHTKSFMTILHITGFLGLCHIISYKWLR